MTVSIEYLAGVLDVNGYMTIRTSRGYSFPLIRLGGEKKMLELFSERFGGHVGSVPSRPNFFWTKQGIGAQEVLIQLRPYMTLRAELVDQMLSWKPENPKKANGPKARVAQKILRVVREDEASRLLRTFGWDSSARLERGARGES